MDTYNIQIVTDCGGLDSVRYTGWAKMFFDPKPVDVEVIPTAPLNVVHPGFIAATHVVAEIDKFIERYDKPSYLHKKGLIINAAPERGDIYAARLDNGLEVVAPHLGFNLEFLRDRIVESALVVDTSGRETPFRSNEVMIPALAQRLGVRSSGHINFKPQPLPIIPIKSELLVGGVDHLGNMYVVPTKGDMTWLPGLGERRIVRIRNDSHAVRCVNGVFAGDSGELVLTPGSLMLYREPLKRESVYYLVKRNGNAYHEFGSPPIGTRVHVTAR